MMRKEEGSMRDMSGGKGGRFASTLERGRVLLALYEGALGFLGHASAALSRQDMERFLQYLERSEQIIRELWSTLDYEQSRSLASMLARLYEFMIFQLGEVRRTRDGALIADVRKRLGEIYAAYRQAVEGEAARAEPVHPAGGVAREQSAGGARYEVGK
jgi:flagellar protein FliS